MSAVREPGRLRVLVLAVFEEGDSDNEALRRQHEILSENIARFIRVLHGGPSTVSISVSDESLVSERHFHRSENISDFDPDPRSFCSAKLNHLGTSDNSFNSDF